MPGISKQANNAMEPPTRIQSWRLARTRVNRTGFVRDLIT